MNEITTLQPAESGLPLTATQLRARLAVIQSVMRDVMQQGADYGVIPGTDKPTLFKPGAEKLCVTFRLSADDPQIESVPELTGDVRYRVRVPIRAYDGTIIAVGVGECSTGEEKYRWRRPVHQKEYDAATEDQRREKFTRNGEVWKQVRVNPADVANTVLKMAHKRAYVHAVIMATAAGAIFTQDIEDLPEGLDASDAPAKKAPVQQPQRKSAAAAAAATNGSARIKVAGLHQEPKDGPNGKWTKYLIRGEDGKTFATNKAELFAIAEAAQAAGGEIDITFTETKFGRDIKTLVEVEREPGADDE